MARILIGNIKGPQGPQGIQGIQGPVGPQGPQGPLPPLINNFLATEAGVGALDAVAGATLKAQLDKVNGDLTPEPYYGDILNYAEQLGAGFHPISVTSNTTNGIGLSGTGHIVKAGNTSIAIIITAPYENKTYTNSYNGAWKGWETYVRNSDLTPTSITLTRTENPYMSATAFNRIQAKKIGPNLILVKFNADIDLTSFPDRAEEIEIGKVNGISSVQMANLINIPAQNGSGTILLSFGDNGVFKILNWSGKPVSGFVRTSFVAVVNFS